MKINFFKPFGIFILTFLSMIVESVYRVRRFCYTYGLIKRRNYVVPIISVGNLSFGGTGKTPFVIWLSNYINEQDKKVMVLTRGHKGKLEHSSGILYTTDKLGRNPVVFGDEALLLSRKISNGVICVGKNRCANLDFYFNKEEPDIVILDDGFQHLKINRVLNIVLFDALMPLSRYKTVPNGYLREGMHALKDANFVVIGRGDQTSQEQVYLLKKKIANYINSKIPVIEFSYIPSGFFDSNFNLVFKNLEIKEKKVVCVVGIAAPLSFFRLLEFLGATIILKKEFPDHYYYKQKELEEIVKFADQNDAIVVTTEKDIVKIKRVFSTDKILYLGIELYFSKGEMELKKEIDRLIGRI